MSHSYRNPRGALMDINLDTDVKDLVEQGKAALDANGDGKVDAQEVLDALGKRFKDTADAATEAADEVMKGFDADGDGQVSFDEVKAVAEGVIDKAKAAVNDIADELSE